MTSSVDSPEFFVRNSKLWIRLPRFCCKAIVNKWLYLFKPSIKLNHNIYSDEIEAKNFKVIYLSNLCHLQNNHWCIGIQKNLQCWCKLRCCRSHLIEGLHTRRHLTDYKKTLWLEIKMFLTETGNGGQITSTGNGKIKKGNKTEDWK